MARTFALAGVVVGLVALLLWLGSGARREPAAPIDRPTASGGASPLSQATPSEGPAFGQRVAGEVELAPTPAVRADGALPRFEVRRERLDFTVAVVDELRQPVEGAAVELQPTLGAVHPWLRFEGDRRARDGVTDARGLCRFDALAGGPYEVSARAAGGRVGHSTVAVGATSGVTVALASDAASEGLRVHLRDANGRPVVGTEVWLHTCGSNARIVSAGREPDRRATSDEAGIARFENLPRENFALRASDGAGARALLLVDAEVRRYSAGEVVLELRPVATLELRVTPASAVDLSIARVRALRLSRPAFLAYSNFGVAFDLAMEDGTFRNRDLPAGEYALLLESPAGLRLRMSIGANGEVRDQPVWTKLDPGETRTLEVEVEQGASIRGRVLGAAGEALAGVRVSVSTPLLGVLDAFEFRLAGAQVWRLDHADALDQLHPAGHSVTFTDEAGSYRFDGLPAGPARLRVFAADRALDERGPLELIAGEVSVLEHRLLPAGVLQGVAPGVTYLGVLPVGSTQASWVAILPDSGLFTFPGLPEGEYSVATLHSNAAVAPVELARAQVEAGRVTWLDLSAVGPVRIEGRLVDVDGAPVSAESAYVSLHGRRARVEPNGTFALRLAYVLSAVHERPRLTVVLDGLRLTAEMPAEALGQTSWTGDVRLGSERVELSLTDPEGRPCAGLVELAGGDANHFPGGSWIPIPATGRVTLRHLDPGTYVATPKLADALGQARTFEVPRDRTVELTSIDSVEIAIEVADANGRPAARVRVDVLRWNGDGPPPSDRNELWQNSVVVSTSTDLQGRASARVPPGDVKVFASGWYVGDPAGEAQLVVRRGDRPTARITIR